VRTLAAFVMLACSASAAAQTRIAKPPEHSRAFLTNADPGDESEVDILTLATDLGNYDGKRVKTRGVLATLPYANLPRHGEPEKFLLRSKHTNAELLLIPSYGLIHDDIRQLAGSELVVSGVVRMLRGTGEEVADPRFPELPPVPKHNPGLPRVSITALGLSSSSRPKEDMAGENFAKQVMANPGQFAGKTVAILGQFRGRNLFGDLLEETRRKPNDWVLKDGAIALWVTDREPKGRGFTLDPGYKGDTSRWLEVEGKPEVVDGVLYLKASKVTLAPRRTPSQ
jgi:hypothetical protein